MSITQAWREAFQGLLETDLLQLGVLIRDLHLQAGENSFHDQEEALLFSEAVFHCVHLLVRQRRLETIWERVVGQDQAKAPDEAPSLTLVDIAQELINGAFMEPYVKDPSVEEQQARVHFALKLDPGCADARPRHASFTYLGTHPGGCSPRLARAFSMCYNSSQRRQAAREARPCLRRNENGGSAPITFP